MFGEEIPYKEEVDNIPYKKKVQHWDIGFGLQATDNLKPSAYMISLAKKQIEGQINYQEIENNLNVYYRDTHDLKCRTAEADYSSLRISEILATKAFTFSPATLLSYHAQLFDGIPSFTYPVGKFRTTNITKEEKVLHGDTVVYADFRSIKSTLNWDFEQEKDFDYRGLDKAEIVHHVMRFISNIWQVHPFREGNTRTVAVFAIKYFRSLGFDVRNEPFKNHSKYFRDALVFTHADRTLRTDQFLKRFTENILLNGQHVLSLSNRLENEKPTRGSL